MLKTPFYTVLEKQVNQNGTVGTLVNHYTDENQALNKYFTVCAAASVSGLPYHAAHIIRDDGIMTEGRVFDRRDNTESGGES